MTIKYIYEFIYLIIRFSGLSNLIQYINRKKVGIVIYHNPNPIIFEKHIKYLNRRFKFITIDKLYDAYKNNNWEQIKNNSLIITFDDGHINNYDLLSIFIKYNIQPIIYLCSNIICSNHDFWWNNVPIDKRNELKSIKNKNRLQILSTEYGFNNEKNFKSIKALTQDYINNLNKYVLFGSHTAYHPILTQCESEELNFEINKSKFKIEQITLKECNHFCYPNGNYNRDIINNVKQAGYLTARTTDFGWNGISTDQYKLKVIGLSDNASINKVSAQLSCLPQYFKLAISSLYANIINN